MFTIRLALVVALFAIPVTGVAQEGGMEMAWPPTPAPQLKKFEKFIGHWTGSGTAEMAPGQSIPWTSKATGEWALDGHAYREVMTIDLGPQMPMGMVYQRWVAWDAPNSRFVEYTISNTGEAHFDTSMAWLSDSKIMGMRLESADGVPVLQRWICEFSEDASSYEIAFGTMAGDADFRTTVTGKYERAESGVELTDKDWTTAFPMGPVPVQMAKVQSMAGTYEMSGEYSPMRGMPRVPISGDDTVRVLFGGHVLLFEAHGDPQPSDPAKWEYEAITAMVWDSTRDCYRQFFVNNMGEAGDQELRFADDRSLVSTAASTAQGQPLLMRGTIQLDETGKIAKVSMDRMASTDSPDEMFIGEYELAGREKKKDEEGKEMKPETPKDL